MYLYKISKLYPLNGLRNSLQVSALSETRDLHPPQLTTDRLKNAVLLRKNYGKAFPEIDEQFGVYIERETHIYTQKRSSEASFRPELSTDQKWKQRAFPVVHESQSLQQCRVRNLPE